MGKSNISYLDMVWNPITGCSGTNCKAHCYAREIVWRFPAIHGRYFGIEARPFKEVAFHEDRLSEPLHWKKPRVVGVGFFGDLFDEQVRDEWIHEIMKTVVKSMHHQYIFLSKQPHNMVRWYDRLPAGSLVPMNVWWGTTVCTQAEADERIPELLKVPGKRWISLEPMLGPVDLNHWMFMAGEKIDQISGVVVGCESGPKRRTPIYQWFHDIVQQCKTAGVPCYVKQYPFRGKVSANHAEWPEELRVQELPWRS